MRGDPPCIPFSFFEINEWLKLSEQVDRGVIIRPSVSIRIKNVAGWESYFYIEIDPILDAYILWDRKVWEKSNQRESLRKLASAEANRLMFLRKDCVKEIKELFMKKLAFEEKMAEFTSLQLYEKRKESFSKIDLMFGTDINIRYKELV